MNKQQSGFTLIELIAVIVILGILAAVAVPKFVDLSEEAETAATKAIVGNITGASALNYAVATANKAGISEDAYVGVQNCDIETINGLMQQDIPSTYQFSGTAPAEGTADGTSFDCKILAPNGTASTQDEPEGDEITFSLIYTAPPSE